MSNINNCNKPIAVTCGDPSSIATELLFKSWLALKNNENLCFFTINNIDYLTTIKNKLGYSSIKFEIITSPKESNLVFKNKIPVINIPFIENTVLKNKYCSTNFVLGKPLTIYTSFIINSINKAIEYTKTNEINAITTLPIEKYIMQKGGFKFIGHTEYLAYKSNVVNPVMLMASPYHNLKVVPVKIHTSLKDSIDTLQEDNIISTIKIINSDLQKYLNKPIKIAVLGLNPHAGEQGLMGKEEISTIIPAIHKLQAEGLLVKGPFPADTAFSNNKINHFDVIVGMYHDQVLTPFKALLFEEGVNVTLGLPYLRTSPDHGTALDIASKNIANPKSVISAITLANMWQLKQYS